MPYHYPLEESFRVAEVRDSFSARLLSDAQFDEALAITSIIEREIRKSGSFKDKLGDYANAYARTERFDAGKADTIIRDLFKARTGQTMNQMREGIMEREAKLTDEQKQSAYQYACDVGTLIEEGTKISFNRAYAHYGQQMAQELQITDATAKRLMAEEFEAIEKVSLYDWGKGIEEQFFKPQIEAEAQERKANRSRRSDAQTDDQYRNQRAGWDGTGEEAPQRSVRGGPSRAQRARSGPSMG